MKYATILYGRVHQIWEPEQLASWTVNGVPSLPPDPVGNPVILLECPDDCKCGQVVDNIQDMKDIYENNGVRRKRIPPVFSEPKPIPPNELEYYSKLYQVEMLYDTDHYEAFVEVDKNDIITNVIKYRKDKPEKVPRNAIKMNLQHFAIYPVMGQEAINMLVGKKWDREANAPVRFAEKSFEEKSTLEEKVDRLLAILERE